MTTIYGKDRRGGSSFREDVPCKLMAQICWCWFRQKELWKVIVKRLTQAIYGSSPSVVGASKWHTARLLEARLCVHKKALMLPTANHQRKGLLMQRRWCRRRRKRERIDGPIVAPLPRRYSIEFAIAGTTSVEPRPKWLNFAGAIAECTLRSRLRRYLSILCITRSKLKPKKRQKHGTIEQKFTNHSNYILTALWLRWCTAQSSWAEAPWWAKLNETWQKE